MSSHWRHNGRDGVSNHQPHDCLLKPSFRRRSKKISRLRVTDLCVGTSPVIGEFPAQRASNAENVSIWWRHHEAKSYFISVRDPRVDFTSFEMKWPKYPVFFHGGLFAEPYHTNVWVSIHWADGRYGCYCLTLVRLLSLPKTLFVNWCGSTKIFRSHLKMCSSSKDSLSILTKSCVR